MRGDAKLDGSKQNISGGLPICFPQFGPGEPGSSIPLHGFARNADWTIVDKNESDCVLELSETEESRKVWPFSFRCQCMVKLDKDKVSLQLMVKNTSPTSFSFSTGIHS